MRLTAALLLLALAGTAGHAAAQRPRRAPRRAPAPAPTGPTARLRCWSERPQDCAAAAERVLKAGGLRRATRKPDSGWSQDLEITYRRSTAIVAAARSLQQFVDELRLHRFGARVSLQGARTEWKYATDEASPGAAASAGAPPAVARLPQGTLRRVKERPTDGDLELALTGEAGKVLKGTEREVDGVVRNRGTRPVAIELAHGCDLDVAVTPRGSDRIAALSPCPDASVTLRIAPADSFVFRGADVPSDVTGSYTAYATLVGTADGAPLQLRTRPLRIDFRKAGKSDVADWAAPRPGCVATPLPKVAPGEVTGSYMLSLAPGVDAEALARYLAKERRLSVAVSTPRYLTLRGSDEDAAAMSCLGGVVRVVRDVEGKKD